MKTKLTISILIILIGALIANNTNDDTTGLVGFGLIGFGITGVFNVGHRLWQLWQTLIDQYVTPPSKPSLPSVEELEKEMSKLWGKDIEMIQKGVATYLHNKYSLHPPQQEWWMKLKKGDRFMSYGQVSYYKTTDCTPYTESELERGLKQADEATKNLIKLACEEAIKTGKIPTI